MLRTMLSICGEPFVFCCFSWNWCLPPTNNCAFQFCCCSAANSLFVSISLAAHYTCRSPVFEQGIHASLAFVVNVCEGFPRPQSIVMGFSVVLQITATLFVKKYCNSLYYICQSADIRIAPFLTKCIKVS